MRVVKESDYVEEISFLLNILCQYFDTDYTMKEDTENQLLHIVVNSNNYKNPFRIKVFIPSKDISEIYEH